MEKPQYPADATEEEKERIDKEFANSIAHKRNNPLEEKNPLKTNA